MPAHSGRVVGNGRTRHSTSATTRAGPPSAPLSLRGRATGTKRLAPIAERLVTNWISGIPLLNRVLWLPSQTSPVSSLTPRQIRLFRKYVECDRGHAFTRHQRADVRL